ncbi:MAG TPA: RNA 2',3'-cyclic phosphodiesterase [Acidobacteriota bacterium]|nr:RNA 2',3'-cyclic phosphodiesterase [Acidobacteriota bacterium]
MRSFIAIAIPNNCLKVIERVQNDLRSCRAEARWVSAGSMHLTLKFLGDVDPAIIPALAEALDSAARTATMMSLRLGGLGCFPNIQQPRVVWCGLDGEIDKLARLQSMIENTCSRFGFARENRTFHPHLTLGRINGKRNLRPLLDCITIAPVTECGFTVNAFSIYRSVLKPSGAEYSVVETIMLPQ